MVILEQQYMELKVQEVVQELEVEQLMELKVQEVILVNAVHLPLEVKVQRVTPVKTLVELLTVPGEIRVVRVRVLSHKVFQTSIGKVLKVIKVTKVSKVHVDRQALRDHQVLVEVQVQDTLYKLEGGQQVISNTITTLILVVFVVIKLLTSV